tara:strand:- start:216 stop:365 length:150 start_codon:yes stop_codon:yes gene_type:complete
MSCERDADFSKAAGTVPEILLSARLKCRNVLEEKLAGISPDKAFSDKSK